jgi:hypothetical protein
MRLKWKELFGARSLTGRVSTLEFLGRSGEESNRFWGVAAGRSA